MSTRSSFRIGITWLVLFCFFSLAGRQVGPAAEREKLPPRHDRAAQASASGPAYYEKEASASSQKTHGRRFPLLVVVGAGVAVGALVYLLVSKKSSAEDQPLVIEPAGTVTDYDGNVYPAVRIGSQVWMAENLRSTHYSDGAAIVSWDYNEDPSLDDVYGRLYTPEAFTRGTASSRANPSGIQGAAPRGWHIPSPDEWKQLIDALGGAAIAGAKLKESGNAHWQAPNTGATNESLFAALPAGMRRADVVFQWLGTRCVFASSERSSHDQTIVTLWHDRAQATTEGYHPDDAVSVRCVMD